MKKIFFIVLFFLSYTIFSLQTQEEQDFKKEAFSFSPESKALSMQIFNNAKTKIESLVFQCNDKNNKDWHYIRNSFGQNEMYYKDQKVCIITSIDDVLFSNVPFRCSLLNNSADNTNPYFFRFILSDKYEPIPGALSLIDYCLKSGIEIYYIENRSDLSYKTKTYDSFYSYEESINKNKRGLYLSIDGKEIGASIYQTFGKTAYDITLETLHNANFPVDDNHLILNDHFSYGKSKLKAIKAIENGTSSYRNGQRKYENKFNTAISIDCPEHYVALIISNDLSDFTSSYSEDDLQQRNEITVKLSENWGNRWILIPDFFNEKYVQIAESYGLEKLVQQNSYLN